MERVWQCVSLTLQVGRESTHEHTAHSEFQLDLCNVTCYQDASWQLSCTEGICGKKKRDENGEKDRLLESAPDLCACNRAIYEDTVAPFLQGELLVCLRSCCANISRRGAPATIAGFSPSLYPVTIYTSFVKHTMVDRHTIKGYFSNGLALHLFPDTG